MRYTDTSGGNPNDPTWKSPFETDEAYQARMAKADSQKGMSGDQIFQLQQMELNAKNAAEQQRVDALASQGLNPDGSPKSLSYNGLTNPDGTLKSQYQLSPWEAVNADRSAIDKFKIDALRDPGQTSQATKLALDKQKLDEASSADAAAEAQRSGTMNIMNQLAQSGGLGGSARERLLKNSQLQATLGRQGVARQGTMDRMKLMQDDEAQRLSGLKDLQGMENLQADIGFKNQQAATDVNKTNLMSLINDNQNKNTFDMTQYQEQVKKWAAGKSSDAMKSASGSGGKK